MYRRVARATAEKIWKRTFSAAGDAALDSSDESASDDGGDAGNGGSGAEAQAEERQQRRAARAEARKEKRRRWSPAQHQARALRRARVERVHVLAGAIMPVWTVLEGVLQAQRGRAKLLRIVRATATATAEADAGADADADAVSGEQEPKPPRVAAPTSVIGVRVLRETLGPVLRALAAQQRAEEQELQLHYQQQ